MNIKEMDLVVTARIMMKNEIDNLFKELVTVGVIFVAICFSIGSFQHDLELKRIHKLVEVERTAKIEAMETAIYLNKEVKIYIDMLNSVNNYADKLVLDNKSLEDANQLIKDIRLSR